MARLIPSRSFPHPGIFFFTFSSPQCGICQRTSSRGWGIVKNNSVLRTLKVVYGSTLCANICTIVSTCKRQMTEKRTLIHLFLSDNCLLVPQVRSVALFHWPHRGAFVRVSWPHRAAFAPILKPKEKCPKMARGEGLKALELTEPYIN